MDALVLAYIGVAALVTITPGADMALAAGITFRHGPRVASFAGWGSSTGLFVHGIAAAIGISAILVQSALLFSIVKLVGGAYLLYLGARMLLSAIRAPQGAAVEPTRAASEAGLTPARAFGRGVLTNVLNPKIAVFYLAFLPQFAEPGEPFFARAILLTAIHAAMGAVWLPLYAHGLARAGRALQHTGRRVIEGATGTALALFGAKLILERR